MHQITRTNAKSFLFFPVRLKSLTCGFGMRCLAREQNELGRWSSFFLGGCSFFFSFLFWKKNALSFSLGGSSTTSTCARGHSARQVVWFIVLYIYLSVLSVHLQVFSLTDAWMRGLICCPRFINIFYRPFRQQDKDAAPSSKRFFFVVLCRREPMTWLAAKCMGHRLLCWSNGTGGTKSMLASSSPCTRAFGCKKEKKRCSANQEKTRGNLLPPTRWMWRLRRQLTGRTC